MENPLEHMHVQFEKTNNKETGGNSKQKIKGGQTIKRPGGTLNVRSKNRRQNTFPIRIMFLSTYILKNRLEGVFYEIKDKIYEPSTQT